MMNDKEFFEELEALSRIEKDYYKNEVPKNRKKLLEFKKELKDEPELKKAREKYLSGKIKCLEWLIRVLNKRIQDSFKNKGEYFERWLYNQRIKIFEKQLKRFLFEIRIKSETAKKNEITEDMILSAREYPIEELIETNAKGFALCPYHDDKHPSMLVKNGFAYCFSCGVSKDVIGLAMDIHNLTFPEAIKFLT